MALTTPAAAATGPLRPVELPDPVAAPDELVLEVTACGVCRTDLQLAEGDLPARITPIVPGHQIVGRVVAVGADAAGWRLGDRAAAIWLAGACGACARCRDGHENLCPSATFTGWDRHGGFAERVAVDAAFAHRLPEGLDDVAAAPLLCGGVIGYRSLRISGVAPGGALGLFGFGASALLTIQVARHLGCRVHVFSRGRDERELAGELGADWTGAIDAEPPEPLDAAITFAPAGAVVVAALRAVRPGGTVAINAIHLDGIPAFDYDLLWGERSLRSVANVTRVDAREFLALAADIPIRTTVAAYGLNEVNAALAAIADGSLRGAAVLVM